MSSSPLYPGVSRAVFLTVDERVRLEIETNRDAIVVPLPSRSFCDLVADEYDRWFRTLHAGPMSAAPAGLPALRRGLRSYLFASWGVSFSGYWQSVIWMPTGTHISGVMTNAVQIGAALQSDINRLMTSERPGSYGHFAERISDILYTYTTRLLVQATLSVSPYTRVESVS
jgi:hypothetical protein